MVVVIDEYFAPGFDVFDDLRFVVVKSCESAGADVFASMQTDVVVLGLVNNDIEG